VLPILKPGKDNTLPLNTDPYVLRTLVANSLRRSRVCRDINESEVLRDLRVGLRPGHSTVLQVACFAGRVNMNYDDRRLTVAVFLHVAETFVTVRVKGLLYKLTVLESQLLLQLYVPVSSFKRVMLR
jgi:hypothetical protein